MTTHEDPRVAVIGAGVAGLTCARRLADAGLAPVVFEKSRGLGGRMATRRTPDGLSFDHGPPSVTPKRPAFRAFVDINPNVAHWTPSGAGQAVEGHLVGVPGMSAIATPLAHGLDVRFSHEIMRLDRAGDHWRATSVHGETSLFDRVVVTVPAPQAEALLPGETWVAGRLARVEMTPTLALMFAVREPMADRDDLIWFAEGPLNLMIRDSSKPARAPTPETWVVHADEGWSRTYLDRAKEDLAAMMIALVGEAIGPMPETLYIAGHRWRYARAGQALAEPFVASTDQSLFLAGDWCLGADVECAFESGSAAADALLGALAL